jgi:hypothetical protein
MDAEFVSRVDEMRLQYHDKPGAKLHGLRVGSSGALPAGLVPSESTGSGAHAVGVTEGSQLVRPRQCRCIGAGLGGQAVTLRAQGSVRGVRRSSHGVRAASCLDERPGGRSACQAERRSIGRDGRAAGPGARCWPGNRRGGLVPQHRCCRRRCWGLGEPERQSPTPELIWGDLAGCICRCPTPDH